MRKDTFIPEHTVLAETVSETVIALTFYPENKNVTVHTDTKNVLTNHVVNIQSILNVMTVDQKNTVSRFFKECAALRLSTTEENVIGEIF